ncbi:hypothetical protein ACU4I5_10855 [Ensifer adhaerens]
MKVLSIRPLHAGNAIARFDIEVPGGIRLFNLKLSQPPRGLRVHSASAFGNSTATFTPETAEAITQAAREAIGDVDLDRLSAA